MTTTLARALWTSGAERLSWSWQQLGMYLAGCALFSLGVKLFIDARLGVDPLHAMVLGLVGVINLPLVRVGLVAAVVTVLFLIWWSCWNRRLPPLSTFVTMALVGYLVDLWNWLELEHATAALLQPVPMMVLALLIDAYASALIIMSGIGIRVMDLLAITIVRRWGWPFIGAKLLFEGSFITLAWILGGPVGVGTIAFVMIVGTFIPAFMWANGRLFGMQNHGLRRPMAT
jgi:uncharacterized membrane protein YczE